MAQFIRDTSWVWGGVFRAFQHFERNIAACGARARGSVRHDCHAHLGLTPISTNRLLRGRSGVVRSGLVVIGPPMVPGGKFRVLEKHQF